MAEKAFNYGKYNKSLYDNLQYDEASATIAQTSSASAAGDILDSGRATISAVSNFAATSSYRVNGGCCNHSTNLWIYSRQQNRILVGEATISATSSASAIGRQIDRGSATIGCNI